MPLIDLETAVDHILRACKAVHKKVIRHFSSWWAAGFLSSPFPLLQKL